MRSILHYNLRSGGGRRISTVSLIILLNLCVYIGWFLAISEENVDFMSLNFLVSWVALEEGRYWTLLTSAFSHNMFWHFFINMYVLNSFGRVIELVLPRNQFIQFYIVASILSSFSHTLVSQFLLGSPELPALGASGAVAGLVILFSLIYPREKIALLGIIPLPSIVGALVFIALDIWGLVAQAEGGGLPIGHGAHLGGAFAGILYYYLYLRPRLKTDFRTVNIF